MQSQAVSHHGRQNRGGDINSQISNQSRQNQYQSRNSSNQLPLNSIEESQRRQISNSSRSSQRSNMISSGLGGNLSQMDRVSQLLNAQNGDRNQLSINSQYSGIAEGGQQPNQFANRQQRRSSNGVASNQQQNNRQNRNQRQEIQESQAVLHENAIVNQIYIQEWEYRTFIHFFETVYHQIMISLFSFLICCMYLYEVSYLVPLAFFFIYDLISIIRSSYRLTLYSSRKSRIKCKIIILEVICIAVAKVNIFYYNNPYYKDIAIIHSTNVQT